VGKLLLVGVGGFLGSVVRYLLSGYVQAKTSATFPYGTLTVNVTGCLCVGALSQLVEARSFLSPEARATVLVGILGGYTTFSAFGGETINLLRDADWSPAIVNVVAHVVLGIGAVWSGRMLAHLVWG
jgi:CrcB protein